MIETIYSFGLKRTLLLIAVLSIIFTLGCKPKPGSGNPPVGIPIDIQNPQWATGTGGGANWNLSNDPDHKVKVKVQTLNSSGQATLYKSYTFNYPYTGTSDTWHNERVEVPETGMFVVQVEILYSECTWQNMTSCNFPIVASDKEYFNQQTFSAKPASITMNFNSSHIINEVCSCQ